MNEYQVEIKQPKGDWKPCFPAKVPATEAYRHAEYLEATYKGNVKVRIVRNGVVVEPG